MTQEKSTQDFTSRLERLKFSQEWTDEQLADRIGVSRRMLWLNRTGKKPISAKTLWKLQQQESLPTNPATGIAPQEPTPKPLFLRESAPPYGKENIQISDRNEKILSTLDRVIADLQDLRNLLKTKDTHP